MKGGPRRKNRPEERPTLGGWNTPYVCEQGVQEVVAQSHRLAILKPQAVDKELGVRAPLVAGGIPEAILDGLHKAAGAGPTHCSASR